MLKLFDFLCNACEVRFEGLIASSEECPSCERCGSSEAVDRLMPGTHTFTTIVATTKTSKQYKAGFQHSHGKKPKTPGKIQVQVPASSKE